MPGVAVLCWEENRPWVSALRQNGFSVPWVEEPKGDAYLQIPGLNPDALVVDFTRSPEQSRDILLDLASDLKSVPVILVSEKNSASRGLKGKLGKLVTTPPAKVVSAVKSALGR